MKNFIILDAYKDQNFYGREKSGGKFKTDETQQARYLTHNIITYSQEDGATQLDLVGGMKSYVKQTPEEIDKLL